MVFLRAVELHSAVRVRALKALRGAAPALRAAVALTARSANRIPAFTDAPGTCPAGARPTQSAARRSWFAPALSTHFLVPFSRQHVRESDDRTGLCCNPRSHVIRFVRRWETACHSRSKTEQ